MQCKIWQIMYRNTDEEEVKLVKDLDKEND